MESITQMATILMDLLTQQAETLGRETGFVQRRSPITGAVFVQTLVLGFLIHPDATYSHLEQVMAQCGAQVSASALEQRMNWQAVCLLHRVLQAASEQVFEAEPVAVQLFERFTAGVLLQDSTSISLPKTLREVWQGCGGGQQEGDGTSCLKVQVRWNMSTGAMQGPWLQDGCSHDRSGEASWQQTPLPENALYVVDSGYVTLADVAAWNREQKCFVAAASFAMSLTGSRGVRMSLQERLQRAEEAGVKQIDEPVRLGAKEGVPVRLLAFKRSKQKSQTAVKTRRKQSWGKPGQGRRSQASQAVRKKRRVGQARQQMQDWIVLISNATPKQISATEAAVLMRTRWQIELLWKHWKEGGLVDTWRSEKPARILCEVYAKLLGAMLIHWQTLLGCWQAPNRSLEKAGNAVRWQAPFLLLAVKGDISMQRAVQLITLPMSKGCRLNVRKKHPNAYQLWEKMPSPCS